MQGQHRIVAGEKVGLLIDRGHAHLFSADGNRLKLAGSAGIEIVAER